MKPFPPDPAASSDETAVPDDLSLRTPDLLRAFDGSGFVREVLNHPQEDCWNVL